ncbi:hypothetical protein EAF04_003061 [Stromatinia cepivora]|nr:hypothetical protein EAF04_003061 [Stromatinia cepivora]
MGTGFCERIDLNFTLDFPVDAPRGHPHLLKIKGHKSAQVKVPEDLSLVDVLATIIFEWKPAALHHLLNMEVEEFYCDASWEKGSLENSTDSDSEISYRICNDGKWEIKSAQYRNSSTYNGYWVSQWPWDLVVCKDIDEEMARDMAERFLVEGVLKDIPFPICNYMPQAKSMKEKSDGRRSDKVKDVRLESSGGGSRTKSSDTLMEENSNAKLTEREAQVSMPQNSV